MTFKKITSLILTTLLLCTILVVTAPTTAEATVVIPTVDGDCGRNHSIALHADGTVWTWGYNNYGQLGVDCGWFSYVPIQVPSLSNIIAVDAGSYHCVALDSSGNVWTWGYNYEGRLGDGTTNDSVTPIMVLSNVTDISASYSHTLALKSDGTVWAWGDNTNGKLGDGTTTDSYLPIQVTGLSDVVSIEAAQYSSLIIKSDGTVWGWGNNYGILGTGSNTIEYSPVQMINMDNAVQVSCFTTHTLVLKNDGTVWVMGRNYYDALGLGSIGFSTIINTPTQLQELSDIVDIATGHYHSLALKSDGTVWGWGQNSGTSYGNGQLGWGLLPTYSNIPVEIVNFGNVINVAGGHWQSLAIQNDGTIVMCGYNLYGQLGNGSTANKVYIPTPVSNLNLFN